MSITDTPHPASTNGDVGKAVSRGVRHDSALPFYAQLVSAIVEDYQSAPPHTPLPAEQLLEKSFGVSRTVVRQALQELAHDGFLYRVKGRGSFISAPKVVEHQFQGLEGFASEMSRMGEEVSTRVLHQAVELPSTTVAAQLGISAETPVVSLHRVRKVAGRPFVNAQTWLVQQRCQGVEHADLSDRSLYDILRNEYGLVLVGGRRVFDAVAATELQAELLGVDIGAPLMRVELTNHLADGTVLEYSVAHHRGDRARFAFDVSGEQYAMSDPSPHQRSATNA